MINHHKSSALILITPIHHQRVVLGGTCQASKIFQRLLLLEEESHVNHELRRQPNRQGKQFIKVITQETCRHRTTHPDSGP